MSSACVICLGVLRCFLSGWEVCLGVDLQILWTGTSLGCCSQLESGLYEPHIWTTLMSLSSGEGSAVVNFQICSTTPSFLRSIYILINNNKTQDSQYIK